MILVGIDDSPGAAGALRWAHRIGGLRNERTVAVRAWAYGRLTAVPSAEELPAAVQMDERIRAAAVEFVDSTLGADSGVDVEVVRGVPRHAIAEAVRDLQPSMVVIGHRKLGALRSVLLGSVGRHLMEVAACPVVLRRDPTTDPAPGRDRPVLVVGVDGSRESIRALEWTGQMATALDAEVVVSHAALAPVRIALGAVAPEEAAEHPILSDAASRLDSTGVPHRLTLDWGDPRTVLEDVATRENADLLVVATRGAGAVQRLVIGSVASYVAQRVERPVAIVPPAERARS